MWIVVGVVTAIAIWWFALVAKTAKLNNDPIQKELCHLILEMMANGATPDAQTIFIVSSARCMMVAFVDPNQQQTRLVHALSMAKPLLNEQGYLVAKRVIRSIA